MKYISITFTILIFTSQVFAGGTFVGGGKSSSFVSEDRQVYFLDKSRSDIKFATSYGAGQDIIIESRRIEEFSDSNMLDAVKRSSKTRSWQSLQQFKIK